MKFLFMSQNDGNCFHMLLPYNESMQVSDLLNSIPTYYKDIKITGQLFLFEFEWFSFLLRLINSDNYVGTLSNKKNL